MVVIAKAAGFAISAEELTRDNANARDAQVGREVSEEGLEGVVAAGTEFRCICYTESATSPV